MIAFISDIHSNTEALGVVLDEIRRLRVERILCLGDVIGYGPEPRETLRRVMDVAEFSLRGNHEDGCMHYASDFNPRARAAIDWTREQLNRRDAPREENFAFWNYLSSMREEHREGPMLLVHGSPRDPIREYIVPRDSQDPVKMDGCFARFGEQQVCFVGHSHVPGVYPEPGGFYTPSDLPDGWRTGAYRAIVNIGSVGQPRDGDPRACFATFDGETIRFHRVEYDVQSTMAKIRAIPELPDYLAERLERGR
ncbi:MAG: metallophosphoesterase family protein [Planctomycetes bacterium]|nr:metallophosphoesterase family protein [Planctomycetota bacterium]